MRPTTPILDKVKTPADLRGMSDGELKTLADELREEVRRRYAESALRVTGESEGDRKSVV